MADLRDLWRGLRVVYRFRPRGGYGFVIACPASVRFVLRKRVEIEIEGVGKILTVHPETLTITGDMRFEGARIDGVCRG